MSVKRFLTTTALLLLAAALAPPTGAAELDEAQIFIEINDTDGDAGIQLFLDGEGWDKMKVFDPDGKKVFDVDGNGSVGFQGITELAFESAEPSFDVQPLADFLALFPEGTYTFVGRTAEGEPLEGEGELTHALPAAPLLVSPPDGADDVDPGDTVIEWQPVADPPGSSIVGYQVIVETEEEVAPGEEIVRTFAVDLGPGATSVTVPAEFMTAGAEYKYEVLAVEESGNKTISEAEFETEEP
jgi:hypothetical protein